MVNLNAIKVLRTDLTAWNESNEDFTLLAAELQLSIWLNEIEQSNRLFKRLVELQPDNSRIALEWANFQLKSDVIEFFICYEEDIKNFACMWNANPNYKLKVDVDNYLGPYDWLMPLWTEISKSNSLVKTPFRPCCGREN